MSAQIEAAEASPVYSGPIFDADTHFWETDEAWTRYLPQDAAER